MEHYRHKLYRRLKEDERNRMAVEPEQIQYPEEKKADHIEYVLKKYLDKIEVCNITFKMTDRQFNRLMDDIKGEDK